LPFFVDFNTQPTPVSEDGDDSDADDDLEVGGMTQDYKCPLTLTLLVDPMTA
jgi:hypothetical protein